MNSLLKIKHNDFGDYMFYFFINVLIYFVLILLVYYYLSKKRITILDFLIMLFLFNVYFILILKDINIIIGLLITVTILLIEKLYQYLYNSRRNVVAKDKVLIKHGQISFRSLIDNNYSYDKLINNLKRKGIKDVSEIDYCALYNNELIVFQSNIKNYPVSLIVDGKLIKDNLLAIKKDGGWLNKSLQKNNLTLKDVSYGFYKNNKLYLLTDA